MPFALTFYCVKVIEDGTMDYFGHRLDTAARRLEKGRCCGQGKSPEMAEADCDRQRHQFNKLPGADRCRRLTGNGLRRRNQCP